MIVSTVIPDSALVDEVRVSPNVERRRNGLAPSILLLHYTGLESMAKAVDWLCLAGSGVSCHYGVDVDGRIIQMVAEEMRAWHAGDSMWAGENDINSASIGIEMVVALSLGTAGGYFVDRWLGTGFFLWVGIVVGIGAAALPVIRVLKTTKLSKL